MLLLFLLLLGIISKNWKVSAPTTNNIITAVMLAIVAVLIIARIILFILYKTVWKQKFISFRKQKVGHAGQNSVQDS